MSLESTLPPRIKLWNEIRPCSNPATALNKLGWNKRPVPVEYVLTQRERKTCGGYKRVVPGYTSELRFSERKKSCRRKKGVVKLTRHDQPTETSNRWISVDSTIHSAFVAHIMKPAIASLPGTRYDVGTRCCYLGGTVDRKLCSVHLVSLSHGVGLGMLDNTRPGTHKKNFEWMFNRAVIDAISSGVLRFIITDYVTTGMFELEPHPSADLLLGLRNRDIHQIPVRYKIITLNEPVGNYIKHFLQEGIDGAGSSNNAACLHYHNALTTNKQILPCMPSPLSCSTIDLMALPRLDGHLDQSNFTHLQTGYGFYSQTFRTTFRNKEAVVKVFDESYYRPLDGANAQALFLAELHAYNQMKDLQGSVIPIVYEYGLLLRSPSSQSSQVSGFCIVMEYIDSCSDQTKHASYYEALNSLKQLHHHGFSHGDIRLSNFIFDTHYRCKIIDLALARNGYDKESQRYDLRMLDSLFFYTRF